MKNIIAVLVIFALSACATKPAPTPTRQFDFKIYDVTDIRENKSALPPFIPEQAAADLMAGMSPPVLFGRQTAHLTPTLKEQSLELDKGSSGQPKYRLRYVFGIKITTPDGHLILEQDMGCVANGTQQFKLVEIVEHAYKYGELVKGTREDRILRDLSRECLGNIGKQIEHATTLKAQTYSYEP